MQSKVFILSVSVFMAQMIRHMAASVVITLLLKCGSNVRGRAMTGGGRVSRKEAKKGGRDDDFRRSHHVCSRPWIKK